MKTGIELPDRSLKDLRERTMSATARLKGEGRILVYGCDHGVDVSRLERDDTVGVTLPCIAMLPPSFIDFVISRGLADGILLSGCREGNCYQRLGIEWTEDRKAGTRDPYLRARVPRERIATAWLGIARATAVERELASFRESLLTLRDDRKATPAVKKEQVEEAGSPA